MTVYLVGAGPGDPGLLTVRGAELLKAADVVVHDRLLDMSMLKLKGNNARLIDVGKKPGDAHSQERINDLLVEVGSTFPVVVRLKGGDPFVFGRGGEEALALQKAGIDWAVVPGVTSAVAVPAYAGIPVTHRAVANGVTVVTGHRQKGVEDVDWRVLAQTGTTLVILMGVSRRAEIASELMAGGLPSSTPVAAIRWGTHEAQVICTTTLQGLGDVQLQPPCTIVVGEVVNVGLAQQRITAELSATA